MFMEKIDLPRVTCDLFGVTKGFEGNGGAGIDTGKGPRMATMAEAEAYADFIRRKNNLPEIGKPRLHHVGGYTGRGRTCAFHYVGATYGEETDRAGYNSDTKQKTPAQYEPGAYSVLFPGANMMRATVTMETLDDDGEVVSSQTMPIEPKKGGVVWSKDDVRKACGPVAKPEKAKRASTVAKRRAAPTMDKRRRAVLLALKLRAELRRERAISASRFGHIMDLTRDLHGVGGAESREDCAAPVTAADAPATAPDAILSDLAAAEALMRGEGYVAPLPVTPEADPTAIQSSKRTPAHERMIRRAWAERKAAREARYQAEEWEEAQHRAWSEGIGHKIKRRRAVLKARELHQRLPAEQRLADRAKDQARLAESIAEDHLRMREDVQRVLRATEARLAAAEAENAQLWAEIEALTAPVPALAA